MSILRLYLASNHMRQGGASFPSDAFVMRIKTDNAGTSGTNQVTLPFQDFGAIDITVDWDDGNIDENITLWNDARFTHTYSVQGEYDVKLTGTIRGWRQINAGDRLKMLEIKQYGDFRLTNGQTFGGSSNLDCSATDAPIIEVASIEETWWGCNSVTNYGGVWDLAGVTHMTRFGYNNFVLNDPNMNLWTNMSANYFYDAFRNCYVFNQPLTSWDWIGLNNAHGFLENNTELSTANYDALLVEWDGSGALNLDVDMGNATYTLAGPGGTAHASLVGKGWAFLDGGGI